LCYGRHGRHLLSAATVHPRGGAGKALLWPALRARARPWDDATVRVTVEISAEFPGGASEHTRRTVSENASSLGFKTKTWE
jgi:hypothetical protein